MEDFEGVKEMDQKQEITFKDAKRTSFRYVNRGEFFILDNRLYLRTGFGEEAFCFSSARYHFFQDNREVSKTKKVTITIEK